MRARVISRKIKWKSTRIQNGSTPFQIPSMNILLNELLLSFNQNLLFLLQVHIVVACFVITINYC